MVEIESAWHETYLGNERFAIFLQAAGNDRSKAIALVDWDREMRGELHKALGEWEVALRNAYDVVLRSWWKGDHHWLLDPESPVRCRIYHKFKDVNEQSRRSIEKAIWYAKKRVKEGDEVPANDVVANLSLDFWRYLTTKAHEKSLWVPVLHRAFPKGSDRARIDHQIDLLYRARNRIAHLEPIFRKPVQVYTANLVYSCELICPPLADSIVEQGGIAKLWKERPVAVP
jgi:hypothetical protein